MPRGIYRPRHPERTSLYQLFEGHFDRYALEYEERFELRHGPLRSVVRRVVEEYLECGRPEGGFARLRCPSCRGEHLLAFSCQTRNFCPSCQAKRAALFAEHLVEDVLSDVPHRHLVFTVPKLVRGLFERERRLLSILPRCAHEAVQRVLREAVDDRKAQVGTVASIQTFGSYGANFHPHVHALVPEGAFHVDASGKAAEFERVPWWDQHALSELFRRLVLRELRRAERLREETESMLLSWQHSGFHVHAGEPVLPDDTDRLEHLARYITRAPIRLDAITPLDAMRVVVRTPPDPQTGSQRMELDVLEMIRRLCAQIPAPRQHLVRYYGWYSHRARGVRGEGAAIEESSKPSTPRSRSWARLLRKIFEVDPLLCPQCNVEMRLVAVIQTPTVIDTILGHLQRIGGNDPHEGTAQRGPPVG